MKGAGLEDASGLGSGFRVTSVKEQGVQGLGSRVQGSGCRVEG